jgi:ABC-type oligopeptide transport system ATPase subunit
VTASAAEPLLTVRGLTKRFRKPPAAPAVNDVSFEIERGTTLGLVGESGSGKSTTAHCILQLERPDAGTVMFAGHDLTRLTPKQLRPIRRDIQVVFQDPYSSLDPRLVIEDAVAEPLEIHGIDTRRGRRDRARAMLDRVGIDPAWGRRHPHQLSGGQRQRVGIARAFITEPKLVVCDEAVSALDVSIQAQVLNLLKDLQEETGLAYLFISHDLAVVRNVSDVVAVMCGGDLVELREADALFSAPEHEYTRRLLSAVPDIPANPDNEVSP